MKTPCLAPVTPRVARLRECALGRDLVRAMPDVRHTLAQDALAATAGQPQALRIAAVLEAVFAGVPTPIAADELLVGCRGASGYPEVDDAVAQGSAEHPYLIADFPAVLTHGLRGLQAQAEARLATVDDTEGAAFLTAAARACNAVCAWAERYADEAECQAQTADAERARELREIAARCRRVPAGPATTFRDALQAVWFTYVALYLETPAASCLGRLDQYLYPYYARDVAAGTLTREEAHELLCCLWVKLYENVLGQMGSHAQTITLGGTTRDGASGVNALSTLCLDVAASMGNLGAQIAIRWHPAQDPAFLAGAFALMARGAIMPQMFNEVTYITALTALGVPREDAAEFALFGCHEPTIAGMGYQRPASWPGYVSFYDWLEEALGLRSEGVPPRVTAIADPPASTDALWARWEGAMRRGVARAVATANMGDVVKRALLPRPLMSVLLRDCLANAADLTAGGARYNMTGFQGCALATAVDAFLAVQTLVFDEGRISMAELRAALAANFTGFTALHGLLQTQPPKYGTDNPTADSVAVRMVDAFCDAVAEHQNARGGRFTPGMWSFVQNVEIGRRTGASPDGRQAGAPISHSMDPSTGQATHGPTAVLRSAARLPQQRFANGGSLLLEFAPEIIADDVTRQAAQALCEGYFTLGGIELQLSTADVARLEAAQAHPERYADLSVRVAGYSNFFVRLTPELQAYVMAREKHRLG